MLISDNFDELICRYVIKGNLTNITQLHIGVGRAETEFSIIDNPLIRIYLNEDEIPYIPGSSFKGVLRTEVEKYLRSLGESICFPYNDESSCNDPERDINDICLACRIFGNNRIGSHVIVSDAVLNMEKFPGIKIKPGIAINRITGTAQKGALYQVETLQPGGIFSFEIQIINIDLKEDNKLSKALKYALNLLVKGLLQIGGKRSTGLGKIKIMNAKVKEIRPENLESLEFPEYELKDLL